MPKNRLNRTITIDTLEQFVIQFFLVYNTIYYVYISNLQHYLPTLNNT